VPEASQCLPGFYTIEVWDPRDLDERLSAKLRKPHDAHAYTLRDLAAQRGATGKVLTRHRIRAAGDLQVNDVADRLGTKIIIGGDGIDCHCFSFVHTGAMSLDVPGHRGPVEAGEERGAIHRGRSGTRALTAIRLERARDALHTEAMSVSGIAIKWGFTNVGRFAALYRRRYGETPTETRGKQ
jgi:AraC-like DNA-binding protein